MLTDTHKAVMVTFFYLGKLKEFGLIEGGDFGITTKGFDVSYDLYKEGFKVSKDTLRTCLVSIMEDYSDVLINQFLELAFHMQEVGVDEMKIQIAEMQETNK